MTQHKKPEADNLIPAAEKWAFDAEVTKVFEAMLENSIPGYNDMRNWVTRIGLQFIRDNGVVIDIGASRGDALATFMLKRPNVNYYAVEISEPMRKVMQERFAEQNNVSIVNADLRNNHAVFEIQSDLILSVLTLMFVPPEHRPRLVQAIFNSIKPGGAFILVEKTLSENGVIDDLLNKCYYEFKHDNGYTMDAIYRKKLSLEGVLMPISQKWNEDMLREAGFKHVQVFWRSCNFCAILAIK